MTSFLKDVASAMAFLVQNGVIHRDLAARNCLVAENYNVKVGSSDTETPSCDICAGKASVLTVLVIS